MAIRRQAHQVDGLRAASEGFLLAIDDEESVCRRILKSQDDLLRVGQRKGVTRLLNAAFNVGDGTNRGFVFLTLGVTPTRSHTWNEGVVLDKRVELQHFGGAVVQVTITHDGARAHLWAIATTSFRRIAIVDGAARPSTPVGVVGAKIVSKLVGHHIQIPRIAVDVGGGAARHHRAEPIGERRTVHTEVCDATRPRVAPLGHQVGDVTLNRIQGRRGFPRGSEVVQHATGVVGEGRHGVRGLPQVHVGGLQQKQSVQFLGVDRRDTGHLGEGPIRGVAHVVVRAVREVVHVNGHLHATTVVGAIGALLRDVNRFFQWCLIDTTREGREVGAFVEIEHGVHLAIHLSEVVLLPFVMKAAEHVVAHQDERTDHLTVRVQSEGLKLGGISLLFEATLTRHAHRDQVGVHLEALELKRQPFWHITIPACGAREHQFCLLRILGSKVFEARHVELDNRRITGSLYSGLHLCPRFV